MYELFQAILSSEEKNDLNQLILSLDTSDKRYFLRNEILQAFANNCHQSEKPAYFYHSSSLGTLIHYTHEIILETDYTWFVLRPKVASQEVWRITTDFSKFDLMTPKEFLDVCDRVVNHYQPHILEIDLNPFYQASPRISDPRDIGQGLSFLNHYLCDQCVTDPQYWLEMLFQALQGIHYNNRKLLISDRIESGIQFAKKIKPAIKFLSELPPDQPYPEFCEHLQKLGFEAGWGDSAARVRETLELLQRLIDTPQPSILEAFVARIPAVFRVVLVSIHGWVAQENVLGRDETLGQVIYVLEQARSLENKLQEQIKLAGLDFLGIKPHLIILTRMIPDCQGTDCNLKLEKVDNTDNAWILRIPFTNLDNSSEIVNKWISKYEIWPYLEKFAEDAEKELLTLFQGKPNLIIGNYSDGNLVAFILSRSLKVIQCNIAHALEKPKQLFSNLYWQELEEKYHFSAQFTADLISMNAADFIIASSHQEIVGTPDTMGQYESYKCFTMPQLYHVVDGIDLFNPKFNMVPPGVNESLFFPYYQTESRNSQESTQLQNLLFHQQDDHILGYLDNIHKRPIFAVAPITSIKNLTGLAEVFGKSQQLQTRCNLILLTSKLYADEATNPEEIGEIEKLYNIINEYQLQGKIRWLGMRLPSYIIGEAYRVIADYRGIYVHFALYEAFGRSILEAMISGLPTFATKFGGALEIIEDWPNGFHLNPTDLKQTETKIINFLNRCNENSEYWLEASQWMIQRIRNTYTWQSHTEKLLLLAKMFSFWNFIAPEDNNARDIYMETIFYLIYKPRVAQMISQSQKQYVAI